MSIRRFFPVVISLVFASQSLPLASAAGSQPDVNFKIYSPGAASAPVGNDASRVVVEISDVAGK